MLLYVPVVSWVLTADCSKTWAGAVLEEEGEEEEEGEADNLNENEEEDNGSEDEDDDDDLDKWALDDPTAISSSTSSSSSPSSSKPAPAHVLLQSAVKTDETTGTYSSISNVWCVADVNYTRAV